MISSYDFLNFEERPLLQNTKVCNYLVLASFIFSQVLVVDYQSKATNKVHMSNSNMCKEEASTMCHGVVCERCELWFH